MTGGDCGNVTEGVAGADSICGNRYAEDVDSEHRTTIMENHETGTLGHKALLAIAGDPDPGVVADDISPQSFAINGKGSLPIRRPDGTQIAPSWADFFNGTEDLDKPISGTEDFYWTGLREPSATGIFKPATSGFGRVTATCSDWGSDMMGSDPMLNYGTVGEGNEVGIERLATSSFFCNSTRVSSASVDVNLLCITH